MTFTNLSLVLGDMAGFGGPKELPIMGGARNPMGGGCTGATYPLAGGSSPGPPPSPFFFFFFFLSFLPLLGCSRPGVRGVRRGGGNDWPPEGAIGPKGMPPPSEGGPGSEGGDSGVCGAEKVRVKYRGQTI